MSQALKWEALLRDSPVVPQWRNAQVAVRLDAQQDIKALARQDPALAAQQAGGVVVSPENKRKILREYLDQQDDLPGYRGGVALDQGEPIPEDMDDDDDVPMSPEAEAELFDMLVRDGQIVVPGYTPPAVEAPPKARTLKAEEPESRKAKRKPDAARIRKKQARHAKHMQKARKGR